MCMKVINVQEAKTQLSKYLEQVAAGEELILGKSNKPMARLIPYVEEKVQRTLGGVEGWVSDDCWEADPELEELVYNSSIDEFLAKSKVAEEAGTYTRKSS